MALRISRDHVNLFSWEGSLETNRSPVLIGDPKAAHLMNSLSELLSQAIDPEFIVGPYVPEIQFGHLLELTASRGLHLSGKKVIDFGCGAHRPLSGALLYYLCGARNVLAIDIEGMFDRGSVAMGIISQVLSIIFDKARFDFLGAGASRKLALQRLADLDLPALIDGDLRKGLPASIDWKNTYYEELTKDERAFDVLISNTVFEHISDVGGTLSTLRANINPGGFMIVVIDYKDHRIYDRTAQSYFQYLMDGSDHLPGYINKIRHSEFVRLAEAAGFRVEDCVLEITPPSPEERARFLPQFAHLSDTDISTCGARILFMPV
jgi:SAM-dependent methyltransferase